MLARAPSSTTRKYDDEAVERRLGQIPEQHDLAKDRARHANLDAALRLPNDYDDQNYDEHRPVFVKDQLRHLADLCVVLLHGLLRTVCSLREERSWWDVLRHPEDNNHQSRDIILSSQKSYCT